MTRLDKIVQDISIMVAMAADEEGIGTTINKSPYKWLEKLHDAIDYGLDTACERYQAFEDEEF